MVLAAVDRRAHDAGHQHGRGQQEHAGEGLGRQVLGQQVHEEPGQGIAATVDGRRVAVGSSSFLRGQGYDQEGLSKAVLAAGHGSGEARVMVGVDGRAAGVIVMADELRPDAEAIVR